MCGERRVGRGAASSSEGGGARSEGRSAATAEAELGRAMERSGAAAADGVAERRSSCGGGARGQLLWRDRRAAARRRAGSSEASGGAAGRGEPRRHARSYDCVLLGIRKNGSARLALISVALTAPCGTTSDPAGLNGLSKLIGSCILCTQEGDYSFSKYISKSNGSVKALTCSSRTVFSFDADNEILHDAVDRFAHLFMEPSLSQDRAETLIKSGCYEDVACILNQLHEFLRSKRPVNNACNIDLPFDNWNLALYNAKTNGFNLGLELKKLYNSFYSANLMRLVVSAGVNLDELEQIITASFGAIANLESSAPPTCLYKDGLSQILFRIASKSPGHLMTTNWPVKRRIEEQNEVASCKYLIYLFNLENEGSIFYSLKKRGWALSVTADEIDRNSEFCFISITMELTEEGQENFEDVCGVVLKYLKMLKRDGPRSFLFDEMQAFYKVRFKNTIQMSPLEHVEHISSNTLMFPPTHWLVGSSVSSEYSKEGIRNILSQLTSDKIRIFCVSQNFEQKCTVKNVPIQVLENWGVVVRKDELHLPKWSRTAKTPKTSVRTLEQVPILRTKKQISVGANEEALAPRVSQRTLGRKQQDRGPVMEQQVLATSDTKILETEKGSLVAAKALVPRESQWTLGRKQQQRGRVMEQQVLATSDAKILETEKGSLVEAKGRVCIIFDDRMLLHAPPPYSEHLEKPERINAIYESLTKDNVFQSCSVYKSEIAKLKYIIKAHKDDYVLRVLGGKKIIKHPDMYLSEGSINVIRLAAGGAIKACKMVADGTHDHAFAVVCPPGHHAKSSQEGGFCFLKNIGIAAKYLIKKHKKKENTYLGLGYSLRRWYRRNIP